ncbi:methionine-gamma-lyase [Melghirimyces thermohalophilus]|uniref:L-methionine gamma-lyase n=1 Tax=Melghirimyces thermohalophilus TaxID=1236220 RepID=A0A1G6JGL4_9BACL|nr:methionine gamma-lyase [Melghirimyces thermohalophilus]SDC17884.1 methionine-gamma-lyase [Melghirimyces thermohalophilus]
MDMKALSFSSRLMHGTDKPCPTTGSLIPPLYQTSTFVFDNMEQGGHRFAGKEEGYIYSRLGNPTLAELEAKMADLEGAEAAVAFSSGMAAVSGVLLHLLKSGDHVVASDGIYGCTFGLLDMLEEKFQVKTTYADLTRLEALEGALRSETRVIYLETPVNPTMNLIDLKAVSKMARQKGIKVVVDNTFATPYLQRPLELGADLVIHSATKYLGGHGDLIAGVAVGGKEEMEAVRLTTLKDVGGMLSPFDAWLLLRGIRTLAVRMDRHVINAKKIARFLEDHPAVHQVLYPGLESHPQHQLAKTQMAAPGGMISFRVAGGRAGARSFLDGVRLCRLTVSLGEVCTLVQHPASMTHSVIPEDARQRMGITEDLIRISVGLEEPEDIIADLTSALDPIGGSGKAPLTDRDSRLA